MRTNKTSPLALMLLLAVMAVVCQAQFLGSDAAYYAARAITVNGQVSVFKDSNPISISVGDSVQVQQMIVTGSDGHALFQVSDGSTFEVYPNSQVVFRRNPGNWRDLVDVFLGRIRVHIEHLGSLPNRSRIMTPSAVISVRGTTFDVSYSDDGEVTLIEVEEGIVDVEHAVLPTGAPRTLTGGQSIQVYKTSPIAQRKIDKGDIMQLALRMIADAATTLRNAQVKVPGGTTAGSPGVGDSTKPAPPTTPLPPPPVPPLH